MANQIQILSVESSDASRLALRNCLSTISDVAHAAQATSAAEALDNLKAKNINIVLIDFCASDIDGIALTKQIRKAHPDVRVLIYTSSDRPEDIFAVMDAGADGYVIRENFSEVLESALRSVRLGAVFLDPGVAEQVLRAIENAAAAGASRILQTGLMRVPLLPDERSLLSEVAGGTCKDGVCMVDPSFLKALKRFAPATAES